LEVEKQSGKQAEIVKAVNYLNERFKNLSAQFNNDYLSELVKIDNRLQHSLTELTKRCYVEFERNLQDKELPDPSSYFTQTGYVIQAGKSKNRKLIYKVKGDFFYQTRRRLADYKETSLTTQKELLQDATSWLFKEVDKIIHDSPEYIKVYYDVDDLTVQPGDSIALKSFKFRKRTWANMMGKPISVKIPFRELLRYYLPGKIKAAVYNLYKSYGKAGFQKISNIQVLYGFMKKSFSIIEDRLIRGEFSHQFLQEERAKALQLFPGANGDAVRSSGNGDPGEKTEDAEPDMPDLFDDGMNGDIPKLFKKIISNTLEKSIEQISKDLNRVDVNALHKRRKRLPKLSGEKLSKKIKEIPGKWRRNQTLFVNSALMELMLVAAQNQLAAVVHKVVSKVGETFEINVIANLEAQNKQLEGFVEAIKADPFEEFKSPAIDWGYARDTLFYKEINDKLMADIKEVISIFPDHIEIMGEARPKAGKKSLEVFENKQFDKIDTVSISLNRLANYLVQNNLSEPLSKALSSLPSKFENTITVAEDVIRLVSFSLNNTDRGGSVAGAVSQPAQESVSETEKEDSQSNAELQKSIIDFVNEGNARIANEIVKIKDRKKRVLTVLSDGLEVTQNKLEPELIIESAGNLKEYIRKSRKRGSLIERLKRIKPGIRGKIAKIWYRKSESFLAARKLSLSTGRLGISAASWQLEESEHEMRMDEFLMMLEAVSPDAKVIDALPFYYRQLFLGKQNVDRAFWTGRKQALADADKVVKWFKTGLLRSDNFGSGGLLVVGEQNAGKTYLSQFIAGKHFDKKRIYTINPPEGGSTDIVLFNKTMEAAINHRDSDKEENLDTLPAESVFILNDLELWWERSEKGLDVIRHVLEMIRIYGGKHFFVVNLNIYSYRYINKLLPFENGFLKILECEPFNAEELKDIILFRHKSTGLKYRYRNHREDDISVWRQAQLFSRYFNYSKGNVGVALQAWISNIVSVAMLEKSGEISYRQGTGKVYIQEPRTPDINRLSHMQPDWILLVLQFILHKRASLEKLLRISNMDRIELQKHLNNMIRVGLIIHSPSQQNINESQGKEIYELNNFLRPHLVNNMVEQEIL